MKLTMKLALTAVVAGVVLMAGVAPASADFAVDTTRENYRAAMWYFVPTVGTWSNELQGALETATVKPEQACKLMPELTYRGTGLVEDLEGTVAPAEMAATHKAMIDRIRALTAASATACTEPGKTQPPIDTEVQGLNRARHTLLAWMLANVGPIQISVQPVTGN